jgi:hypothetical protein
MLLVPLGLMGQEKGIRFIKFANWQEIREQSQKTNKSIFFRCLCDLVWAL